MGSTPRRSNRPEVKQIGWNGRSEPIYASVYPCGCRQTADNKLERVCSEHLTMAAQAGANPGRPE
jgi:hypothetical protein